MCDLLYTPSGTNFMDPKLGWWQPWAMVPHSASMISYGLANDNMNFRKEYQIPDDHFLFGDSGGFQNLTMGRGFSPGKVIRWQERNCDAGMILDFPPYQVFSGGRQTTKGVEDRLDYCLERTLYNAEFAMRKRSKSNFKLYGVIQGSEWHHLEDWYKALTKDHTFDGYAMAPKPASDPMRVALFGLFALTHFDQPIHFFQCGSFEVLPIMVWMTKYNRLVTFDNSNYIFTTRKLYHYPFWRNMSKYYQISDTKPTTLRQLPCNCPPCTWINEHGGPSQERKNLEFHNHSALHRLHWYLEEISTYQRLLDDEDIFFEYVKSFNKPQVIEAIKLLSDGMERGPEKVIPEKIVSQTGISNYFD